MNTLFERFETLTSFEAFEELCEQIDPMTTNEKLGALSYYIRFGTVDSKYRPEVEKLRPRIIALAKTIGTYADWQS